MSKLAMMFIGLERLSAGFKRHSVQVDDHQIAYSEGGKGERGAPSKPGVGLVESETVVLVHGFGASSDNWNRMAGRLTKKYRVIAPDMPGWGQSTRIDAASYAYPEQIERLHQFLGALGLRRFHLIGHSMGGFISSAYAARYPEEVITLTLIAPHGVAEPQPGELALSLAAGENWLVAKNIAEFERLLNRVFARRPYLPRSVFKLFAAYAIRGSAKSARIFADMQSNDPPLEDRLPLIQAPTLIIWGDQDRVLNVSGAKVFHEGIKNSELLVQPGIGHMPLIESARECTNAWLQFVEKARGSLGAAA